MGLLIPGLALFLGAHSVSIVAPAWRDRVAERLGNGWRGLFSIVSLAGLILVVVGYGAARSDPIVLYDPPFVLRYLNALLMLPVFPLLLAAYLPGGIQSALKHPMLVATKLWATAHLLVNGTLADVALFGAVLVWAAADRVSLKYRVVRKVAGAPPGKYNDVIAIVGGLVLYVIFIQGGHTWVTGKPIVFPR